MLLEKSYKPNQLRPSAMVSPPITKEIPNYRLVFGGLGDQAAVAAFPWKKA